MCVTALLSSHSSNTTPGPVGFEHLVAVIEHYLMFTGLYLLKLSHQNEISQIKISQCHIYVILIQFNIINAVSYCYNYSFLHEVLIV